MMWGGADAIITEIKCAVNVRPLNHPQTIPHFPLTEKLSSRTPGPRKVGGHWTAGRPQDTSRDRVVMPVLSPAWVYHRHSIDVYIPICPFHPTLQTTFLYYPHLMKTKKDPLKEYCWLAKNRPSLAQFCAKLLNFWLWHLYIMLSQNQEFAPRNLNEQADTISNTWLSFSWCSQHGWKVIYWITDALNKVLPKAQKDRVLSQLHLNLKDGVTVSKHFMSRTSMFGCL